MTHKFTVDSVEDTATKPKKYITPSTDKILDRDDQTQTALSLTKNNIGTRQSLRPDYNTFEPNTMAGKLHFKF